MFSNYQKKKKPISMELVPDHHVLLKCLKVHDLSTQVFMYLPWIIDIVFYVQQMALQIGKTKVFLRAGQLVELDARKTVVLGGSARVIQSQIRTIITQKQYNGICRASIHIQAFCRG